MRAKRNYFYFNRSMFYIRDPLVAPFADADPNSPDFELLTRQSEKMFNYKPQVDIFVSGIVHKMRQSRESQVLMMLGEAAWMRDEQFLRVKDFLASVFWADQPRQSKKVECFLSLLQIFGCTVDDQGQLRNFLFGEFQFEFDSLGQMLLGLQFRLVTQFTTFMSRADSLGDYPLIFFFLDDFFCSDDQESLLRFLPEKTSTFKKALNSNAILNEKVETLKKQFYKSIDVLNLDPNYVQEVLYVLLALFYFNHLRCESNSQDEWRLVKDAVHDELVQILGLKDPEFFSLLVEVFTADDGSMEFHKKTSDFRNTIKLIPFIVYEKVLFDFVAKLNVTFPKCGEPKNLHLAVPFYPNWSGPHGAFYDDLHINYLNEQMGLFYSESVIGMERRMYREEGLGRHFPKGFDSPTTGAGVLKVLDCFRAPPGMFQLLETANKLNKTNKMFLNDLVKFFKQNPLVEFNKFKKHLVSLSHSHGHVGYDFSGFNEKNKYYLDEDYKTIFKNFELAGILQKYEYKVETINKVYKSDIYRTLVKEYLDRLQERPLTFLVSLQVSSTQHADLARQLRVLRVRDLVNICTHLFPVKMKLRRFCRKYLELDHAEPRHYARLPPSEDLRKVAMRIFRAILERSDRVYGTEQIRERSKTREGIMNAHNRGNVLQQTHLIGIDKVFFREHIFDQLEDRLTEITARQQKWKSYLVVKINRFRQIIRIRRMIAHFRKNKRLARQSLSLLIARGDARPRFLTTLRTVRVLQDNFRFRRRLRMARLFISRMNMVKNKFRARNLVMHTLTLRQRVIKVQRRARRFLTFRKVKKRLEVKEILYELASMAADIARVKRMTRAAIYIQKCWRRKLVYRRYAREIEYLRLKKEERLMNKMALRIQKNWKLVRWRFRIRRLRAAADVIRKNFLAFIWRQNFLKMKNGMIRIQRMFRMSKTRFQKDKLDYYLRQSKFEDLLVTRKQELLRLCHESIERVLTKEKQKETRLRRKLHLDRDDSPRRDRSAHARPAKTISGTPPLRVFSLLVDFGSFPNKSFFYFGDYFKAFNDIFAKLEKFGELPLEFHCADSHLFALSDRCMGYYWGDCDFVYRRVLDSEHQADRRLWAESLGVKASLRINEKEKQWKQSVHRVSFWGKKPIGLNSGSDFCSFLYSGGCDVNSRQRGQALRVLRRVLVNPQNQTSPRQAHLENDRRLSHAPNGLLPGYDGLRIGAGQCATLAVLQSG